jgi:nucleoside-diphosphate-sugar epimerase
MPQNGGMSERLALVTGANGFVGRALVDQLKSNGWRVRAALRNTAAGNWDECVAVGDLALRPDWRAAVEGVDAVFHLAARVHVMHETHADPLAAFMAVNRDATLLLLEAAEAANVRRLIHLSTLKVLGDESPTGRPFCDDDSPAPPDAYGRSKLEAEALLAVGAHRVEPVIVRPPLVYGPGVGANFRRVLDWVARGVPLPFGAIENRRSLVYVGHLAEALVRLADAEGVAGRRFLIDDGRPVSTPELLRAVARAMNRPSRLIPVPPAMLRIALAAVGLGAEAQRLTGSLEVDANPLFEALNWRPGVDLDSALKRTIAGV